VLCRSVRELLSNIVKHAGVRQASVRLQVDDNRGEKAMPNPHRIFARQPWNSPDFLGIFSCRRFCHAPQTVFLAEWVGPEMRVLVNLGPHSTGPVN
jgi:hypothetical protein